MAPPVIYPNCTNIMGILDSTDSRNVMTITITNTVMIPILKAPGCFLIALCR